MDHDAPSGGSHPVSGPSHAPRWREHICPEFPRIVNPANPLIGGHDKPGPCAGRTEPRGREGGPSGAQASGQEQSGGHGAGLPATVPALAEWL